LSSSLPSAILLKELQPLAWPGAKGSEMYAWNSMNFLPGLTAV